MARRTTGAGSGDVARGTSPARSAQAGTTDLPGQRGSQALLRDLNVNLLIELVRQTGPISRADLARPASSARRPSRASSPSCCAGASSPRSRWRHPAAAGRRCCCSWTRRAGYVVGIKLRGDGLTTVVCDLEANVAAASRGGRVSSSPTRRPRSPPSSRPPARYCAKPGSPRSKVLGVGIGLSGLIDSALGTCRFSHLLDWADVPIADPLSRVLRLPVWVDNDVNTLAVAEKWSGEGCRRAELHHAQRRARHRRRHRDRPRAVPGRARRRR